MQVGVSQLVVSDLATPQFIAQAAEQVTRWSSPTRQHRTNLCSSAVCRGTGYPLHVTHVW